MSSAPSSAPSNAFIARNSPYAIWIADDDPLSLRALELRLTHAGYRVQSFPDGRELLSRLDHEAPDLILSDVVMPDLNGFALCRQVRGHLRPEVRGLPLVLLTALEGEEGRSEGVQAGASDFLSKPVQFWELLARIEAHLRFAELARQHSAHLPALLTPASESEGTPEVGFFEPDEAHAQHLAGVLGALGYRIRRLENLLEATRLPLPDLLLLDIVPPHHAGVTVCRALKERSATREVPLILMAEPGDPSGRLLAWDAGADEYFEKPLERSHLGVRARALLRRKFLHDQLTHSFEDLSQRASLDPLTGLSNRGTFDLTLERELGRAQAEKRPLALILLDVDHFKHYNDRHGHPAGDDLLRILAGVLSAEARRRDTVARYGGEEFALILPEAGEAEAARVAERLRECLASTPFHGAAEQPGGRLTVSMGVAALPEIAVLGPAELLERADQALYAAKRTGRDRVCFAPPDPA